jgi:energy-coupling factor transport system ATP-binding protein
VLRIEDLTYRYAGASTDALDSVSLSVDEGELVLVAGVSASGKSTLLRAASGLVPHFHGGRIGGTVEVGGLDTRDAGPAAVSQVAASLFQDPESQVVTTSVRSELGLPLELRGHEGATLARAVEETALQLGIGDLLDRAVDGLSGGELQRVALASALIVAPRLLLLDEPTSQLDPVAGDELIWLLRRLNEEWGTSVLLSEHRLERCLAASDRVVALEGGRIAFDGAPVEFVEWATAAAPELAPPVSTMFALGGIRPIPVGAKDGRALLTKRELLDDSLDSPPDDEQCRPRSRHRPAAALELRRVWVEYPVEGGTVTALRGLDMKARIGEVVALVGRNGAGKSTLLRVAAGLESPGRGRVKVVGEVALVLQRPGDYFLHERVRDELPRDAVDPSLEELGLGHLADADPRDLSGGERQRLALAIVLAGRGIGGGAPPAVVALDEPTRGMDRRRKEALASRLQALAREGAAVLVATHDVEFASRAADRCVLLGRGQVVADGNVEEVLAGGRYFTTEVARLLGPGPRVVSPEQGAAVLARRAEMHARVTGPIALTSEDAP